MNSLESQRQETIEEVYKNKTLLEDPAIQSLIRSVIADLDTGKIKVVTDISESTSQLNASPFKVNEWIKKSILLYFQIQKSEVITSGPFTFFDKIPLKTWSSSQGVRVVPQALARFGSFIEAGAILMPSYINIGAHVGSGTMVDTWATVGSCAQIGRNVHLSGGVGIGGVLEPLQAAPVIIEDDVFVGSRAIIVEGVRVGPGAVIGAGVTLTASTKILDVSKSITQEMKGYIPPKSVVIPGTIPKVFPSGTFGVPCALIIGERKESTDKKTSLNNALRDFEVSV
jgi:2,3,4,5-tetrahydropyridine-2-carboxylate N-succinyltransferase